MTGLEVFLFCLGLAGGVLMIGLALLAVAAFWFALIGSRESPPRASPF